MLPARRRFWRRTRGSRYLGITFARRGDATFERAQLLRYHSKDDDWQRRLVVQPAPGGFVIVDLGRRK